MRIALQNRLTRVGACLWLDTPFFPKTQLSDEIIEHDVSILFEYYLTEVNLDSER